VREQVNRAWLPDIASDVNQRKKRSIVVDFGVGRGLKRSVREVNDSIVYQVSSYVASLMKHTQQFNKIGIQSI